MKLKKSVVAFIDLLGFSRLVETYSKSKPHDAELLFESVRAALDDARRRTFEMTRSRLKQRGFKFKHQFFSDCVCISLELTQNKRIDKIRIFVLSYFCSLFQFILLDKGLLVRGGISIGEHYSNNTMIFSLALIKAHKLEQCTKYPRIEIDPEIVSVLHDDKSLYRNRWVKKVFLMQANVVFINPYLCTEIWDLYSKRDMKEIYVSAIKQVRKKRKSPLTNETITELVKHYIQEKTFFDEHYHTFESISKAFEKDTHIGEKYKWLLQLIAWLKHHEASEFQYYFDNIQHGT